MRPGRCVEKPVILWDFDGTLAERPSMWTDSILAALDALSPGHGLSASLIRPSLQSGFPWHHPDDPWLSELNPDAWWRRLGAVVARRLPAAVRDVASDGSFVTRLRSAAVDQKDYRLRPDCVASLELLTEHGWCHAILSNHFPELPVLIERLGLSRHFLAVVSSAVVGYCKPRPEIFFHAARAVAPRRIVWMIGDNPVADFDGGRSAGYLSMLIAKGPSLCQPQASSLREAADMILAWPQECKA